MNLVEYFKEMKGTGILATSNSDGRVNSAIYARPHFFDEQNDRHLAFIMRDRLTHNFLQSNPNAFYMFIERGEGYQGKRLVLKKTNEETDRAKIDSIRRRDTPSVCSENEELEKLFLVYFDVLEEWPLIEATRKKNGE